LLLMDYEHRRRVKIWGTAKVVPYEGEELIVISVTAWDVNCPQHIPRKINVPG
jgi:hypothetical protein